MSNPVPLQFTPFTEEHFKGNPSFFNLQWQQMVNAVNLANGSAGKTVLPSGIDVAGSTVSNLGDPRHPLDAVSKAHAEKHYSAAALVPQLEAGGNNSFKGYRSINSKQQQENYSNFLEPILNTAPTANSSLITGAPPSGGSVVVTVSAGYHLFPSGSVVTYVSRTDTLSLPISFNISSISRSGGVVTAITSLASGFLAGQAVAVAGVSDSSYDGSFILTSVVGTTVVWDQIGANTSSSSGTISENGCYYYYIESPAKTLSLAGPFAADTQQNRISVNIDGTVLIAVAVLSVSGLDLTQSAAGATPPAQTGNARLLTRL